MDRALSFRRHLEPLCKKLTFRVELLKRLAGSSWGADATVLRTATFALIHYLAEYCAPVRCCSACTRLIDEPISHSDQMPVFYINGQPFYLIGIQPIELRRQKAAPSLACRAQEPEQLLYERLLSPLCGQLRQLKYRHPIMPAALEPLNDPAQSGNSVARLVEYK